jgi:hypothetical protein
MINLRYVALLQGIVVETADGRMQTLPSRLYVNRFPESFFVPSQRFVDIHGICPSPSGQPRSPARRLRAWKSRAPTAPRWICMIVAISFCAKSRK